MNKINRINVDFVQKQNAVSGAIQKNKTEDFSKILEKKINEQNSGVKFSEHAKARLKDRHIELTEQDQVKINNAVDRAAQKGSNESLLLLNDLALLVSVKNRTVITAMDQRSQSGKVFTNIDSAVIVK